MVNISATIVRGRDVASSFISFEFWKDMIREHPNRGDLSLRSKEIHIERGDFQRAIVDWLVGWQRWQRWPDEP